MGFPGGLYRPTPRGTMVIWLEAGPRRRSLRPSSSPPTTGARRLAGPTDRPDTVAALLMTLAWSCGYGNSAAVRRAFTVAIPHLVWLMACEAHGRGRPTPGGRLSWVRLQGARAVFRLPTDRRPRCPWVVQVGVVGTMHRPLWLRSGQAWQQCRASQEIFSDTAYCSHIGPL